MDDAASQALGGVKVSWMSGPLYELPESIELSREEYRAQHTALEAALNVLMRSPTVDPEGEVRRVVGAAHRRLLRRIWPFLDELDRG